MRPGAARAVLLLAAIGAAACTKANPNFVGLRHDAGIVDVDLDAMSDAADAADVAEAADVPVDRGHDGAIEVAPDGPMGCQSTGCRGNPAGAVCAPDGTCVECLRSPDCGSRDAGITTVACDTVARRCVGCLVDGDCAGTSTPVCDVPAHTCVRCLANPACAGTSTPVCDVPARACVGCLANADCTGTATRPICETTSKTCRGCTKDSECPADPGICFPDGHCGASGEVFYVRGGGSCPGVPGNGGLNTPFCQPAAAVAAITTTRRTLVLRGTDLLPGFTIATGGAPVNVYGQQGATIAGAAGAAAALEITNATVVNVRGLRIANGLSGAGVYAHGNASLRMDRCQVDHNPAGGILVDGATYDITNTAIANNTGTFFMGVVPWAGMYIGTVPAGGPSRFVNNTVAFNLQAGLVCTTAPQTISGLILWMNTGGIDASPNCGVPVPACCTGDPLLDPATYRLMSGSPCIDQITTAAVTTDIDGQARPQGARSDCGADELLMPLTEQVDEAGSGNKAPILLVVGGAERCGSFVGPRLIKLPSTLIIGREPSGGDAAGDHLAFEDKLISRAHLRVSRRADGCIVEDAGSVNGTFLDGRRLTQPTRLTDGDILFFGGHAAVFRRVDGDALRALEVEAVAPFGPVPTSSPELAFVLARLRRLATSATEMLLVGETGVGKEVYARAVHQASGRKGRFVAINCAAIPASTEPNPGLTQAAHGGTLFLDDIGDMAPPLQARLLRFIEERVVDVRILDVRILAATTPSGLSQLRPDLLGRLGAEPLHVPPLRDRIEDLGALIAYFIAGRKLPFETPAFRALCLYGWPENVRELMNVVERMIALADVAQQVRLSDLPASVRAAVEA